MAGVYLGCAKNGIPVVIDGFISSVAALCAYRLCENVKDYMIPSHMSEEPGMKYIIKGTWNGAISCYEYETGGRNRSCNDVSCK